MSMVKEEKAAKDHANYIKHRDKKLAYQKQYYIDHQEETLIKAKVRSESIKDKRKVYADANKDHANAVRLKRAYGLDYDDYIALKEKQQGKCAICGQASDKLQVDHDHETKIVRGLLCWNCNIALGYLHDSVETVENAAYYLKASKEI